MAQTGSPIATIMRVIAQAPQWIRADLVSKDATMRTRAEEALAAMIAAALAEPEGAAAAT